jgi:hypothetical protein
LSFFLAVSSAVALGNTIPDAEIEQKIEERVKSLAAKK